jgi:hypothetical protein
MFSKDKGVIASLVGIFILIAFIIAMQETSGFRKTSIYHLGNAEIPFVDHIEVYQPFTATNAISTGNYESFDFPLGVDYFVPIGNVFVIGEIVGSASTNDLHVQYGYGDTHVTNSVSSPTNPVVLGSFTILSSGIQDHHQPTLTHVPEGKYPFVNVLGGNSKGAFTLTGIYEITPQ